jgi:Xaa-Pro aminopeptidase
MRTLGIRTLIVGPGSDMIYLTGFHAHVMERLVLLIVHQDGKPAMVSPMFEVPTLGDYAEELVSLYPWNDGEDPAALASMQIGGDSGTIAVASTLHSVFLIRLQQRIDATWVEAGPLMRELRVRKDAAEIEALQQAATRTDEAWEEFVATASITGLTEAQALQQLLDLTAAHGVTDPHGLCASGPHSASPHHSAGDRLIQPGDSVVFDWGGTVDGYFSDVTRTVHVGEPSEEYVFCYNTVLAANEAAFKAVKPGVPLEQIDIAARELINDAGYGWAFSHRVGHGLGLDIHEEPYLVAGNREPVEAGMVFSDEPGIYIEGKFGIRIEDSVLATEDGARKLNNATRDLTVMS